MRIFGAPIGSISDGAGGGGAVTLTAAAQALGVPSLTAELGGGATFSRQGETIASQGVTRILKHIGILPNAETEPPPPVRLMRAEGREAFTYAPLFGISSPPPRSATPSAPAGSPASSIRSMILTSRQRKSASPAPASSPAAAPLPSPPPAIACSSWWWMWIGRNYDGSIAEKAGGVVYTIVSRSASLAHVQGGDLVPIAGGSFYATACTSMLAR